MKLLLTSKGIVNKSIKTALLGMLNKDKSECKLVFVPTAANPSANDKGWLIDNFRECQELGLASVGITDISALSEEIVEVVSEGKWEKFN